MVFHLQNKKFLKVRVPLFLYIKGYKKIWPSSRFSWHEEFLDKRLDEISYYIIYILLSYAMSLKYVRAILPSLFSSRPKSIYPIFIWDMYIERKSSRVLWNH